MLTKIIPSKLTNSSGMFCSFRKLKKTKKIMTPWHSNCVHCALTHTHTHCIKLIANKLIRIHFSSCQTSTTVAQSHARTQHIPYFNLKSNKIYVYLGNYSLYYEWLEWLEWLEWWILWLYILEYKMHRFACAQMRTFATDAHRECTTAQVLMQVTIKQMFPLFECESTSSKMSNYRFSLDLVLCEHKCARKKKQELTNNKYVWSDEMSIKNLFKFFFY